MTSKRLLAALPSGRTLPPEEWQVRHAWMVRIVWAHAVGLLAWALLAGYPVVHAAMDVAPVAAAGALARTATLSRRIRAGAVCVGLLTSSAVVIHLMDGAIEGHFHFFVMVTLLALYEEWFPYGLAIGFVLAHHGVMGIVHPDAVFAHADAVRHPWKWASIHALFIAGLSMVNLVSWRLQEDSRSRTARSEQRLRWAFEDAPIGMAFVDLDGTVQRVNGALCRALGRDADALVGGRLAALVDDDVGDARAFPSLQRREEELRYRRSDGSHGWSLWHHSLILDDAGAAVGWVSHFVDITERKRAEELLTWRASHDALTELPNRAHFHRQLGSELERRARSGERGGVAMLFVDIDDFKAVNDAHGHAVGDALLRHIAGRLRAELRSEDVIARFGGDEFTVLLANSADEDAADVAGRLTRALQAPFAVGDVEFNVSVSVGLAFADDPAEADAESLMRDADAAMYRAKQLGKGRLDVFRATT